MIYPWQFVYNYVLLLNLMAFSFLALDWCTTSLASKQNKNRSFIWYYVDRVVYYSNIPVLYVDPWNRVAI